MQVVKRAWKLIGAVALLSLTVMATSALAEAASPRLTDLVRQTMAAHFDASQPANRQRIAAMTVAPPYDKPAGVFVTLSRAGKSRACWGSVYPRYRNVLEATMYATLGALTKEYRYPPISRGEWAALKPQVTVVKVIEPIDTLRGQNPLRDGLMVRSGARSGVILPGEARDATYQLVLGKLKAGLAPGQSYQMYRIIADVYQ